MPRIGAVIREVYHRPGADALPAHLEGHYGIGYREHTGLTPAELGRAEGVLWVRILWLSASQCWLACVSAKVHQGFFPRREYITALAAAVRAQGGGAA